MCYLPNLSVSIHISLDFPTAQPQGQGHGKNNNQCFLSTYYMSDGVLSTLHALTQPCEPDALFIRDNYEIAK